MLLRLLRTYLRTYRKDLLALMGLQLLQTIAMLYLPRLNADILDNGVLAVDREKARAFFESAHAAGRTVTTADFAQFRHTDIPYIWKVGGLMLVISVIQVLLNIGAVYYGSRAAAGFGKDVRGALFHKVTDFSAQEVNTFGAPSLITRITNDVQQVQMLVQMLCTLFVSAPIMAVGGVIMAVREDRGLSWVLVCAVAVLMTGVGFIVSRMVPYFRLMQEQIDGLNRVLREQITGIRVLRAFVREPHEAQRFSKANAEVTGTALRSGRTMAMIFPIVTMTINCSSTAVLWFGASKVNSGEIQLGSLVAFLSYLTQVLTSVTMATFMTTMIPRAAVCAERIVEVLDTPSSVVDVEHPVTDIRERGLLELRNVSFAYPGAESPVLSGVDLVARKGTTTAIIGSTGSGKTSLLNLVPRLFDATGGQVLVDGVDVRELALEDLWTRVGLVPQKPFLFTGTVASNLRYGNPRATDEELWEALEVAQARDFVAAMPGGLEGKIVQGGTNVSGGQRQRLAIARALVRKPEIYLFDDSFSALDLATDARLRAALAPRVKDAAMVIVAQRVSTIAKADQILVLEDGEVVGLGTHEQLLESCPTYVEIVESQFTEEAAA